MKINTVLFDLGGTLESVRNSPVEQKSGIEIVRRILASLSDEYDIDPETFKEQLLHNFSEYKHWCTKSCIELSSEAIWGEWMLRGYPSAHRIAALWGDMLGDLWESCYYCRSLREEVPALLNLLEQESYQLGIISNTSSSTLPIRMMQYYGIAHHFKCILLSSQTGIRKPDPMIFLQAAAKMEVDPSNCFYVGDQVAKDVMGSQKAGYGGDALLTTSCVDDDGSCETNRMQNLMELPGILAKYR